MSCLAKAARIVGRSHTRGSIGWSAGRTFIGVLHSWSTSTVASVGGTMQRVIGQTDRAD